MGSREENTKKRWVFGGYTVYCPDVYTARRIYEIAYTRADRGAHSGFIELADGLSGRWELKESRRHKAPTLPPG